MNKEDNKIFLHFIEQQFKKNNEIYYEDNGLNFWGENSHQIFLTSNGNHVNFVIENHNNTTNTNPNAPPNRLAEISIEFEECIPLLNSMYKAYLKTNQNNINYKDNKECIQNALKEVKNYLKEYSFSANESFSFGTTINIPNTFEDHILRVGRMLNGADKKSQVGMLGFTNIPLTLYKDHDKNYDQINLIIPYWEIHQYPCLQKFISVPEPAHTLHELLNSFKKNESSLHSHFFHHIIDNKVENKNDTNKQKNKL